MVTINLRIPDDLHKQFRIMCATQETSMNKTIVDLIYSYVHADERLAEMKRKMTETFEQVAKEIKEKTIEKEQKDKQ